MLIMVYLLLGLRAKSREKGIRMPLNLFSTRKSNIELTDLTFSPPGTFVRRNQSGHSSFK